MNFLSKSWPALLILMGGILAAWGSWVSSKRNDKQQEAIQNTGEVNRILGENNRQLGVEIQKLQHLNNDVANNTRTLVEENKRITNENLILTSKTKALTENVEDLTIKVDDLLQKVHNEITGANSVPIVKAELHFYPFNPYERPKRVPNNLFNNWVLNFMIENQGDYPLKNIRVLKKHQRYNSLLEDDEIPIVTYIDAHESKQLISPIIGKFFEEDSYIITVKWKIEYTYVAKIIYTGRGSNNAKENYSIEDYYNYKDVKYKSLENFKKAIRKDLTD